MGRKSTRSGSGPRSGKTRKKSGAGSDAGAKDSEQSEPEFSGTVTTHAAVGNAHHLAPTDRLTPEISAMDHESPPALSEEAVSLQLEADAAIAGAPPEPAIAGELVATPIDAAASFRPVITGVVGMTSAAVLPQWELSEEEKGEFSESLSLCFAALFPDGLDGKYACWFRLVAVTGVVIVDRAAKHGGKLPGIGPKRPDPEPTPEHGHATPA